MLGFTSRMALLSCKMPRGCRFRLAESGAVGGQDATLRRQVTATAKALIRMQPIRLAPIDVGCRIGCVPLSHARSGQRSTAPTPR